MKKPLYLLFLLLLIINIGKTQVSGKYIGATGVGAEFSIQDNEGKLIPIGAKEGVKGNPYLLDNWSKVTVYLTNGTNYTDSAFNYSLIDEKLYFNKNNKLFIVSDQVKEFVLMPQNYNKTGKILTYRFANGYPIINGPNSTSPNTFFQVLSTGPHYQLLKWQHKIIREVYTYGSGIEYEYVNQYVYYIFDAVKQNMISIGNKQNISSIKNTLSIDDSIWKAYFENHAANSKGEEAMIDLMTFLNTK